MAILTIFLCLFFCGYVNAGADTAQDQGKALYLSYGCALCHGLKGDGKGLNDQKFAPPPTNFHHPQVYLHGHDMDSIKRSIRYGIQEDKSIMPSFKDIPADELDEIAGYLLSLQNREDNP